ncbi:SDR family oxidoreductase [Streptomyces muensis]|uniref:SDR family oxidoreductase n=1 Tax=Streptomyces muensis TaxID=1077944 RepID=A0A9X1PWG4_STRM4|nr:SDR family oxidoreductase [Streptomyces muensis]MCF1592596.1 SDR family oxidoreductase [Streptomyces muensis]
MGDPGKERAAELFSVVGRTALVTGATSGIGAMAAAALAEAGAVVHIVARNAADCEETASKLPGAVALPADLSTRHGIAALADRVPGPLHILVNNAGTLRENPLGSFTEADWDDVMDLNLKAPFFLTQDLLPALRAGACPPAPATVIHVGSVGGLRVGPRQTYSYAASKAGLHQLTKSMARWLAAEHITVNAIAPGLFPSRMTPGDGEQVLAAVSASVPQGRTGRAEDIGGVVRFLASSAAAYITGAVIPIDGGLSL